MALPTMNYLLNRTYEDATHNPNGRHPQRDLRLLYQNNEVHPISVAQTLCHTGCLTQAQFALQFGDTDAEARAALDPPGGGGALAPLWSNDVLEKAAQIATYLAVRLDARQGRADMASARAAITRDASAKPLVGGDREVFCERRPGDGGCPRRTDPRYGSVV